MKRAAGVVVALTYQARREWEGVIKAHGAQSSLKYNHHRVAAKQNIRARGNHSASSCRLRRAQAGSISSMSIARYVAPSPNVG